MKHSLLLITILLAFVFTACQGPRNFTKTKTQLDDLKKDQAFDCQKDNLQSAELLYKEAEELNKKEEYEKADIKIMAANEILNMIKTKKCPEKKEETEIKEETTDAPDSKDTFKPEITEIQDPANEQISLKVVSNYTPETVYFDFNSYQINEATKKILLKHLEFLMANPQVNIQLGGHTDSRGSEEYNLTLAEKRGLVIQKFFVNQGISKEKIKITSYGEELLADPNNTEEAHSKNRRVEFQFLLSE